MYSSLPFPCMHDFVRVTGNLQHTHVHVFCTFKGEIMAASEEKLRGKLALPISGTCYAHAFGHFHFTMQRR